MFDGLFVLIKLEIRDLNLLSQSLSEAIDFIYMKFEETEVFLSQNLGISTTSPWLLEFNLPLQIL